MTPYLLLTLLAALAAAASPIGEASTPGEGNCHHLVKRGWDWLPEIPSIPDVFKEKITDPLQKAAEDAAEATRKKAEEIAEAARQETERITEAARKKAEEAAEALRVEAEKATAQLNKVAGELALPAELVSSVRALLAGDGDAKQVLDTLLKAVTASEDARRALKLIVDVLSGGGEISALLKEIVGENDEALLATLSTVLHELSPEGTVGNLLRQVIKTALVDEHAAKTIKSVMNLLEGRSELGPIIVDMLTLVAKQVPAGKIATTVTSILAENGPVAKLLQKVVAVAGENTETAKAIQTVVAELTGKGSIGAIAKPVIKAISGEPGDFNELLKSVATALSRGEDIAGVVKDLRAFFAF